MVAVLYEGKLHGLLDDQQIILKNLRVTTFYNGLLDYLLERYSSVSINTSHERCYNSDRFLQHEL